MCTNLGPNTVNSDDVVVLAASDTESQALIAKDRVNDLIVVAMRGTTPWDLSYWIIDAGAFPQRIPEYCATCFVHTAFYAALAPLKSDLYKSCLQFSLDEDYAIAISGHSAGGASALLIALDLASKLSLPPGSEAVEARYIFTYGAPRVGNRDFAELLQSKVGTKHGHSEAWRVVYGTDPVPYTVPSFLGYTHPFVEVHIIDDRHRYRICAPLDTTALLFPEDNTCSLTALFTRGPSVEHHYIYFDFTVVDASCGMINEDNSYYNSTIELAITGGFQRAVLSWLPL